MAENYYYDFKVPGFSNVKVILIGERHTVYGHILYETEILSQLVKQGKKVVVVNEYPSKAQTHLDSFLKGNIDFKTLNKKLNNHIGDDARFYYKVKDLNVPMYMQDIEIITMAYEKIDSFNKSKFEKVEKLIENNDDYINLYSVIKKYTSLVFRRMSVGIKSTQYLVDLILQELEKLNYKDTQIFKQFFNNMYDIVNKDISVISAENCLYVKERNEFIADEINNLLKGNPNLTILDIGGRGHLEMKESQYSLNNILENKYNLKTLSIILCGGGIIPWNKIKERGFDLGEIKNFHNLDLLAYNNNRTMEHIVEKEGNVINYHIPQHNYRVQDKGFLNKNNPKPKRFYDYKDVLYQLGIRGDREAPPNSFCQNER